MNVMKNYRKSVFRVIAVILAFIMVISLGDMSGNRVQAKKKKNIVVLYFSATGTTKATAKKIKKKTKGKLIEIKAEDPYTAEDLDYGNSNSRVTKEHESASNPAKSKVRPKIANLKAIKNAVKKADVVYIGYAGGIIGLN